MERNSDNPAESKPMIIVMKLKESLKRLLKERDITASQLARATKVSVKTIHNWQQGQMPKNLDQLKAVADFFAVSLEQLCWGEPPKTRTEKNILKDYQEDVFAGRFDVILRKVKE